VDTLAVIDSRARGIRARFTGFGNWKLLAGTSIPALYGNGDDRIEGGKLKEHPGTV